MPDIHHPATFEGQLEQTSRLMRWINRNKRGTGKAKVVARVLQALLVLVLVVPVVLVLLRLL